ncbi:MAG: hypothetical protein QOH68_1107 [Nocardioidaceae bacterium]|jgi:nitronate monooxygenase|nr:hypothetical protein [Nocardioidaceae bacterium]
MWWANQAQGLIHEVSSCAEVVGQMIAEAHRLVTKDLAGLVT